MAALPTERRRETRIDMLIGRTLSYFTGAKYVGTGRFMKPYCGSTYCEIWRWQDDKGHEYLISFCGDASAASIVEVSK